MESPSGLEKRFRAVHEPTPKAEGSFFDDIPARPEPLRKNRKNTVKRIMGMLIKSKKLIIVGAVVLLVLWLGVALWNALHPGIPGVDQAKYQAVFLVDGTQYVGKLTNLDSNHYKLTSAFFVTANTTPVVSDQSSRQNATNQVALVKLDTGLLNSENEMTIPKDKVLFYENLKSDGQAAKLIDNNK